MFADTNIFRNDKGIQTPASRTKGYYVNRNQLPDFKVRPLISLYSSPMLVALDVQAVEGEGRGSGPTINNRTHPSLSRKSQKAFSVHDFVQLRGFHKHLHMCVYFDCPTVTSTSDSGAMVEDVSW